MMAFEPGQLRVERDERWRGKRFRPVSEKQIERVRQMLEPQRDGKRERVQ